MYACRVQSLATLLEPILAGAPVDLAILYGSMARGTSGPGSDVDIGVTLVRGAVLSMREQLDLGDALERAVGREVDLVLLDDATPLLRHEAARGECLYERAPGAFGDFVTRALFEWDDVRPHFVRCARALMRGAGGAQ
jgi:predicted nucleotidyltransferase